MAGGMNKRILEFMAEVGMSVDYLTNTKQIVLIEKFAELIVRECALTAGLMEHEGRPNIGRQILDNFGVES